MFYEPGHDVPSCKRSALSLPRMIWKAEILTSQVRENFSPPETIDKDGLLKGHDVERFTFGAQLQHFLDALVAQLRQFESALSGCAPETFLRGAIR